MLHPASVLPAVAADSLANTFRRLAEICPSLQVEQVATGPTPHQAWVRTDRLAASVEELIAAEAARIAAEHGSAPRTHVAASRLLHHYLWSACLLISGPWYLERKVPELAATDLWIHADSADFALRPGRWAPGDEAALRAAVVAHVRPVLAAFQPYVKRGPHALWGMAADDLVSGLWYLGRMLGEETRAVEIATAVLPGDTAPFPGAAEFRRLPGTHGRTHWTRTRLGCCLYYAIKPAETCLTCPRTCDPDRVRRLEA